jgi:hypothetical protein
VFDAPAHNLDGGVRYAAGTQALKKVSQSAIKWSEMLQHVQKNAAHAQGYFEREIALQSRKVNPQRPMQCRTVVKSGQRMCMLQIKKDSTPTHHNSATANR